MAKESPYAKLFEDLKRLRKKTARFRRVALHVHSPDSRGDWRSEGADKALNDTTLFEGPEGPANFATELRKHFDLVAITDHMKCGFACDVSKCVGKNDDFVVLPGMEVNFVLAPPLNFARIHLVVIMPQGTTSEQINRLFQGCRHIPDDQERTGQEEVRDIDLEEWVETVHGEGGICIAAHVDNGIRSVFRQKSREVLELVKDGDVHQAERDSRVTDAFKEYLFRSKVDAIEIVKPADTPHYRWTSEVDGEPRNIATILTFDAHSIEELARNDRVTHIKLTRLGLTDLQAAFRFPDTRIRFPGDLPPQPSPFVAGIQISGGQSAFFEDITVAFAENLNCLIGIRGSGKSTIVEALRYVFGYNRDLDKLEDLKKQIVSLQEATLTESLLRVVYRTTAGDNRVLEATFDPKSSYQTKVYSANGDVISVADVERCGDYPLRLYGWSEIEKMGRSPEMQRDLLDYLIPELRDVLDKRDDVRAKLAPNRADVETSIEKLLAIFRSNDGEITRYNEYRDDLANYDDEKVKGLFRSLDIARDKAKILHKLKENAEELRRGLAPLSGGALSKDLDLVLNDCDPSIQEWWSKEGKDHISLSAAERRIDQSLAQVTRNIDAFVATIDKQLATVDLGISGLEKKLRGKLGSTPKMQKRADLRAGASKRLERVKKMRTEYLLAWRILEEKLAVRVGICQDILAVQDEISTIRAGRCRSIANLLSRFLPPDMRISINHIPGQDKRDFASKLGPFLRAAGQYKKKGMLKEVTLQFNPFTFAKAVRDGSLGEGEWPFEEEDAAKISEVANPIGRDENADVSILPDDGKRLRDLLSLEEIQWDDYQVILLNDEPVNGKSPGQRSSAMLPLIALAQETPLIIDQPEDNVDKRLLGTVLVRILSDRKQHRQIIVCTHDPNIPVGGDAEQLIVLEAISDHQGRLATDGHGSIDDEKIIHTVIDLLEGGEQAFVNRRKRYGL